MTTDFALPPGRDARPDRVTTPVAVLVVFAGGGLVYVGGVWGAAASVATLIAGSAASTELPTVARRRAAKREARRADKAARRGDG